MTTWVDFKHVIAAQIAPESNENKWATVTLDNPKGTNIWSDDPEFITQVAEFLQSKT